MCDEGMALARERGAGAIDVQRTMRSIQRRMGAANEKLKPGEAKHTLHAADGIHLNDLGQLAMAYAILKGLGAPAEVSAAALDAQGPTVLSATGCRIANLLRQGDRLEFDRLDEGLPLNFGVFGALQFRFIPIPDELNRYLLTIKNLPEGDYEIHAGGRALGKLPRRQLETGANLASVTADAWEPGGPWDAQAALLIQATDARHNLSLARLLGAHYLPTQSNIAAFRSQAEAVNDQIEAIQRLLVQPVAYHFVIQPAATAKPR